MMPRIAVTPAAMRRRATALLERVLLASWRACREFVEDRGHRDAAQIGFFAMLSAIPLALLLVGAFGWPFDEDEVRNRVVATVFDSIPLATEDDRDRLESTTRDALEGAGRLGPLSIVLLVVASSGVMSALRHAINQAWDIQARPPLLRRKALDVLLVLGATVILLLSLSVTATRRAERIFNREGGSVLGALFDALGDVLPYVFTGLVGARPLPLAADAAPARPRCVAWSPRRRARARRRQGAAGALFRAAGELRGAVWVARRAHGAPAVRLRRIARPGVRRRVRVGMVAAPAAGRGAQDRRRSASPHRRGGPPAAPTSAS
jgi:hypothetical protein